MAKIDVSLVLACYNEGPTLSQGLSKIKKVLDGTRYLWEMICIDDKSQDETSRLLEKFAKGKKNVRVFFHKKNVGRGGTVAEGIKKARGKVVGFIDVDLEVSPVYIPEFVRAVNGGADMAIATRIYQEEISALPRWLASKGYVLTVRSFLGLNYKDTEAGYKFFNRRKILPILKKTRDKKWFFDTEIVARSTWSGLKVEEISVLFLRRTDKKSTVRLIPDTIAYLKAVWAFKRKVGK